MRVCRVALALAAVAPADRTTRQFVSRGEISFTIQVNGEAFNGTATAVFFDADGRQIRRSQEVTLEGRRVTP